MFSEAPGQTGTFALVHQGDLSALEAAIDIEGIVANARALSLTPLVSTGTHLVTTSLIAGMAVTIASSAAFAWLKVSRLDQMTYAQPGQRKDGCGFDASHDRGYIGGYGF